MDAKTQPQDSCASSSSSVTSPLPLCLPPSSPAIDCYEWAREQLCLPVAVALALSQAPG